jgi:hypothetical protein
MKTKTPLIAFLSLSAVFGVTSQAAVMNWADWQTANANLTEIHGEIVSGPTTIDVTYKNPQSAAFLQTGAPGEIDYWQNNRSGRNPATSPYTSTAVDNIPTGTDIVGLRYAGSQSLHFSEAIANPVFSFVSLNGNGYAFDRDFDILSFASPTDGNDNGYWGGGLSYKNVVDLGGGNFEYQLLGTGEPHGTIRFAGAFQDVTWRSLTDEFWNGFTVGVEGTAQQVFNTPEAGSTAGFLALALPVLALARRKFAR